MTAIPAQAPVGSPLHPQWLGRCFVNPLFDYLLIGGGLSLFLTAAVLLSPELGAVSPDRMAYAVLVFNSAHFASSTVRLYTKPGSLEAWPFLTMVFPLVMLGVLALCLYFPASAGTNFQALYLTWSPFHYAAQVYGLSVMYSYRSGCQLQDGDKKLLRWVTLFPFFYSFLLAPGVGLDWLLPRGLLAPYPTAVAAMQSLFVILPVLAFTTPLLLFFKVRRGPSGPMPLICVLLIVSNGVWWFVLPPFQAFVWATIFHAIQYLAIVVIFHVKEHSALPGNTRSPLELGLRFYGVSLLGAYALFQCLPFAFVFAGFGVVESTLMVVAAINIHHFVVDGFIWRLRGSDRNRAVAEAAT